MKNTILLLFILQFGLVLAQNPSVSLLQSQTIDADFFVGIDGMDNLYCIKNNVFIKKNKQENWQYKNISLGKITKTDIQNPLKIMLFYENFNTIVLLDNQLNEIQRVNFSENHIPILARACGIASANRLWVYNGLTQEIGLFDYLKNNFQSITPAIQGEIKYYQTDFNSFQWADAYLNWYSCDVFGKIISLGKVTDFRQIQFVTNQVVLFSNTDGLYLKDCAKNSILPIENSKKSIDNFYYRDQILTIFTNQEISNYKITIP